MEHCLRISLVISNRREFVTVVADAVTVRVDPFARILGECVDAVVVAVSIAVCDQWIESEFEFFSVWDTITIVVCIRVISDPITVGVEPFCWVEREFIVFVEIAVVVVVVILVGISATVCVVVNRRRAGPAHHAEITQIHAIVDAVPVIVTVEEVRYPVAVRVGVAVAEAARSFQHGHLFVGAGYRFCRARLFDVMIDGRGSLRNRC